MIHLFGAMEAPIPRLLETLRERGHEITDRSAPEPGSGATLMLSTPVDWMQLGVGLARWQVARGVRVLVMSRMGAHPDARAESLRSLWRLEEYARVSLVPTLTLRLAPLAGPASPFWRKLGSRPRLAAAEGTVVMPVLETDVVELLHAALDRPGTWEGWFDVCGPEALTLGEWCEVASSAGAERASEEIPWEPPLEELAEHRLAEPDLWQKRYGVRVHEVSAWARRGKK